MLLGCALQGSVELEVVMRLLSRVIDIKRMSVVFIISLMLPQALVAEEMLPTEFEHCILQEYDDLQQSSETAFQIGTCFYQIVHERCGHETDHEMADHNLRLPTPISSQIILQYADSWFVLAAKEGHAAATEHLEHTRQKLAELESS